MFVLPLGGRNRLISCSKKRSIIFLVILAWTSHWHTLSLLWITHALVEIKKFIKFHKEYVLLISKTIRKIIDYFTSLEIRARKNRACDHTTAAAQRFLTNIFLQAHDWSIAWWLSSSLTMQVLPRAPALSQLPLSENKTYSRWRPAKVLLCCVQMLAGTPLK